MTLRAVAFAFLSALMTVAGGQSAQAQILTIEDTSNNLGTVNIATGAVDVIGNLGGVYISDIAYSPTGVLYGESYSGLYKIDPATAGVTFVGALGISGANALVFGQDGTLYSASYASTGLYSVNTATGAATSLGNTGFESAGDLAFDGGTLYLSSSSNRLIRINLSGGVSAAAVGPFGFSDVYGLATADNGILYGVSGTRIFSINTSTGHGTQVLEYSGHGLGTAGGTSFITEAAPPPPSAPEPGPAAVFALGCVSVFGSHLRVRARRRG